MCSTRNRLTKAAACFAPGLLLLSTSCTSNPRVPGPEPLNNAPVNVDPAMEARQWDPSTAEYANDTVRANPDYTPLRASESNPYLAPFAEIGVFCANTIYLPVGIFIESPGSLVDYKSLSTPPTSTAQPPLPPVDSTAAISSDGGATDQNATGSGASATDSQLNSTDNSGASSGGK